MAPVGAPTESLFRVLVNLFKSITYPAKLPTSAAKSALELKKAAEGVDNAERAGASIRDRYHDLSFPSGKAPSKFEPVSPLIDKK